MNFTDNTIRYLVVGGFVSIMSVALIDGIGSYSKNSCMQSALERELKPKDIAAECKRVERRSIVNVF